MLHIPQLVTPADFRHRRTINPRRPQEVQYWASQFDVPPSRLIGVMREVGRNVGEIRKRFAA